MLKIKRVYEEKSAADGKRIYIDRIWPRGLSKEEARIDEWIQGIAPSGGLRKWFGHEPEKFQEFKRKYIIELSDPEKQALLKHIAEQADKTDVTLLFSARNTENNNAVVLFEIISKLIKEKTSVR